MARMQRVVTGSQYDHVGLLLRYPSGKISIFESLNETGVGVVSWSKFMQLKWFKLYSKVAYRKLNFERDEDFNEKINDFVLASVGKNYKINASKLLSHPQTNEETFFCSELVATAY